MKKSAIIGGQDTTKQVLSAIFLCVVLMSSSVATAGQSQGRQVDAREPQRSYGAIDVILYQTSWCPYCVKAREFLKSMGVSLTEVDIEKDSAKSDEMITKSGSRGVPVVDIEGVIIRGYAPDAMRSAIERKRRD
jgi:glutaredoxin-like YruB-family protein